MPLNNPAANDSIRISSNDTTSDYLINKLVSTQGSISLSEINDGANETLGFDVNVVALTTVTPDGGDFVLISDVSDSNNLKKVTVADIAAAGGSGAVNTVGNSLAQAAVFDGSVGGGSELEFYLVGGNLGIGIDGSGNFNFGDIFSTYDGTQIRIETGSPVITLGDVDALGNGTTLVVDDDSEQIIISRVFQPDLDSNVDIGTSSLRFATGYFDSLNLGTDAESVITFSEIAAPSNPAADKGILYSRDDGGTTTLYFKDSAGVETDLLAGGSPGGVDTQLQYNDGGAFGGMVGVTWNDGTSRLTFASGTAVDLTSADFLRIPNSGAPVLSADGDIAIDLTFTDFAPGPIVYRESLDMGVVAMRLTEFVSPVDGQIIEYDTAAQGFILTTPSFASSAITLTAGDGLSGGGDLTANRTFDVDINPETLVTVAGTDELLIADASDSFNIKKVTAQDIADLSPSGDVTGPGSSTDNAIVRWDGVTGTVVQNSGVIISDSDDVTIPGNLIVEGTTTSLESETILIADNYVDLNSGHTAVSAQTGGATVNYLPTATVDTVAGAFVAGVPATSNPVVTTTGSGTFSVGDIIQISDANDASNNGIYEVLSHTGTALEVRGIGLTAAVEDFTKNQFTADATVAGDITKVNVSVIRAGTDGEWEVGKGSSTALTFSDVAYSGGAFHDGFSDFIANEHIDHTSVTLTAGDGLSGGGDISANRTFDVDINPETLVTLEDADELLIADASDSFNIKKVTASDFVNLTSQVTITSDTSPAVTGTTYLIDASSNPVELELPNVSASNDGKFVRVYTTNVDNAVTITTVGGTQTIGGETTQSIKQLDKGFTVQADNTNMQWNIIQDARALGNFDAGSTYETLQDQVGLSTGRGIVSGGVLSDGGSGTVDVTGGEAQLREGAATTSRKVMFDFSGTTGIALTDASTNFVYLDRNGGTPTIAATTNPADITGDAERVVLGFVYRDGTSVYITNFQMPSQEATNKIAQRLFFTKGLERQSGLLTSEVGTRNLTMTSGFLWLATDQYSISSFDTSAADTWTYFYRDGVGGWTEVAAQSAIDNTQYDDDSGTLATLSNNKYGVHWVYIDIDDNIRVVYGQGDYTLLEAQEATIPIELPPFFQNYHVFLVAKVIIQENAASFTEIELPFDQAFQAGTASNHSDLSNLGWTVSDHTGTATRIAGFDGTGAASEYTLAGTGTELVLSSITLTAGEGLTGGGDLSANRSFALDFSDLSTTDTTVGAADLLSIHDGAQKKITFANFEAALNLANLAGTVDISAQTNLVAGTNITLAGDTLNVDDAFLLNTGDTGTGVYDFGGATSFEIPNSATPTVDADGEIAVDTTVTDFSHGILKYFGGEELGVVAMPIAEFTTPTDGHVVAYNATNDEFELVASGGSGDVTSGANITDHAIVRGDGGVKGVQDSGILIDDLDNITAINTLDVNDGTYNVSLGNTGAGSALYATDGSGDEVNLFSGLGYALYVSSSSSSPALFTDGTDEVYVMGGGGTGIEINTVTSGSVSLDIDDGINSIQIGANLLGSAITASDGTDTVNILNGTYGIISDTSSSGNTAGFFDDGFTSVRLADAFNSRTAYFDDGTTNVMIGDTIVGLTATQGSLTAELATPGEAAVFSDGFDTVEMIDGSYGIHADTSSSGTTAGFFDDGITTVALADAFNSRAAFFSDGTTTTMIGDTFYTVQGAGGLMENTTGGNALNIQNTTDAASNQVATFRSGNRVTAADNDEGYISFYNDNDLGAQQEFSRLSWIATDVTSTTKDANLSVKVMVANTLTEVGLFTDGGLEVPDEAYGAGWNGSTEVPTKNAVYDQIESLTGANTALSNLSSVAINTSLVSDTDNTDDLGSSTIGWQDLYLSDANTTAPATNGQINYNNTNTRFEFFENSEVSWIEKGWHGSATRIKILPRDFMGSDVDRSSWIAGSGAYSVDDNRDIYTQVVIPAGYKATHVMIYGDVNNAVTVYENELDDGTTVTSKGSGNANTEIDITDVNSTTTNYLTILVETTSDQTFGGYVTIAKI